jgi:hypothetical protein
MGCGCLLSPLKLIWSFLRWCFSAGWKGWVALGLVSILLLVGTCKVINTVKGVTTPKTATTQPTTIPVPSKFQAPYIVTTDSRYYYAKVASQKDGITTMTDYWELAKGKWVSHPGTLVMGKEFGKVTVGKR